MILIIFGVLFVLYVIFRLSTINYKLNVIMKHFNIVDNTPSISNEEIEKELDDMKES